MISRQTDTRHARRVLADSIVDRLAAWKQRYGTADTSGLEALLSMIARRRCSGVDQLIRLHETLVFLRAYPHAPRIARLADHVLFSMAGLVAGLEAAGADLSPLEAPEVSGIAGTSLSAAFSYEVARRLSARYRNLEIDWDGSEEEDRLGPVARRFVPLLEEDWPVEAHPPFRKWLHAAVPRGESELRWLLERVRQLDLDDRSRADLYEGLQLHLRWELRDSECSRSRLRVGKQPLYCHDRPLLKRRDVVLNEFLKGPRFPISRLSPPEARRILDIILDTSAVRYRELYGFTHPDTGVFRADAGRGVEVYFLGLPPAWRLPVRAYHSGLFVKNGVPAGYVEVLSLFDRAEVGFNLYYTFREGESAWLYARLLRLFHQTLGVNVFSVDPYQVGHDNEEAVDSGAFWFYRKLGFRPVEPAVVRLLECEELRLGRNPEARTSPRILRKLAAGYLLFEGPGAVAGMWDSFRVRNLGFAVERAAARRHGGDPVRMERWAAARVRRALGKEVTGPLVNCLSLIDDLERWTPAEKYLLVAVLEAKYGPSEARYLRLMQKHTRLRSAFLSIGSR